MSEEGKPPTTAGRKGYRYSRYAPSGGVCRSLCCFLLTIIILAGIIALILYLVYRPSKPKFSVVGVSIYDLNVSSPTANAISTNMQFTIVSRNPSDRSSIFYDRLSVYVTYMNQPITPPAPIPPLFQDTDSTVAVAPIVGASFVPVSPNVAAGLLTDQSYGAVTLRVVLIGRLKYKAGPFRSVWYGMFVRCDLLVGIKKGVSGQVPLLGESECGVDI